MSCILDLLRHETRHRHAAIERVVPLNRPGAHEGDYTEYLQALYAFHVPVEAALSEVSGLPGLGLGLEARAKVPRLTDDLRALGTPLAPLSSSPCEQVPRAVDIPSALGVLYVLEGATLGGQVVLREWKKRFPQLMAKASSYLQGYGEGTGAQWKTFLSVLDAQGQDAASQARIVRFACDAFDALHRKFAPPVQGVA